MQLRTQIKHTQEPEFIGCTKVKVVSKTGKTSWKIVGGIKNEKYTKKTSDDVEAHLEEEESIPGGNFVFVESQPKDEGSKLVDFPHVINIWSAEAFRFCFKMGRNPANICSKCYFTHRDAIMHENIAWRAWANAKAIRQNPAPWHPRYISVDPLDNVCRINSNAEIGTVEDALWLLNTIISNPSITFGWWTKQPHLVQKAIKRLGVEKPGNVILIYSEPKINPAIPRKPPEFFDRVFSVFTEDEIDRRVEADKGTKKTRRERFVAVCRGAKCNTCRICYDQSNLLRTGDDDIDYRFINEKLK